MRQVLDKAKCWEYGVRICAKLRQRFEKETFNYPLLAWLLAKEADLFNQIVSVKRFYPNYYTVSYYGAMFPEVSRFFPVYVFVQRV